MHPDVHVLEISQRGPRLRVLRRVRDQAGRRLGREHIGVDDQVVVGRQVLVEVVEALEERPALAIRMPSRIVETSVLIMSASALERVV